MTLARALLWLSVATFGSLGAAFTVRPAVMGGLVDIALTTPTSRVDFTATYGGFELGFAAFLLWCALTPERVRTGLVATGLALTGFGLVRLAGILIAVGPVASLMWWLSLVEIGSAVLIFLVVRSVQSDERRRFARD